MFHQLSQQSNQPLSSSNRKLAPIDWRSRFHTSCPAILPATTTPCIQVSAPFAVLSKNLLQRFYQWDIESGFREIKQKIGSARSQTRNAHAVINHLNFCMMATTITWIYADRITADPQRRHIVKGRTSFAFSDVRRLITHAALSEDFLRLWPPTAKSPQNPFVSLLLRMVA